MQDQRRSPRKSSFLAAYASEGSGSPTLFCMVRDVSSRGARLEIDRAVRLPERFELHINGRERVLHVEVSWRNDTNVGVRFVSQSTPVRAVLANVS